MTTSLRSLLAKSDGTTLEQHTRDVENAARVLAGILPSAPDLSRAAWLHDLGKSALFFQAKMNGDTPPQWYRHELFSFLWAVSLKDEVRLSNEELAAILSHHRQLWVTEKNLHKGEIAAWCSDGCDLATRSAELQTLVGEQLQPYLAEVEALFGPFVPLRLKLAAKKMRVLRVLCEQNSVWTLQGRALMLHRGALVASDHLASAGLPPAIAGRTIFARRMKRIVGAQLRKRRKEIGRYVRPWHGWNWMQQTCAHTRGNALLVAPTGAGKTEASLLWALNNRKGGERIFYVLPYQVSINAMAKRLAELFPDENGQTQLGENGNVAIVHSNSDLAYLQESLRDDVPRKEAEQIARANRDAARQLYAPLKVTTVYQLLNLFFGRKFFEVGLLELSNALVIFDEIHAYDGHTLGLILVLLDCLQKMGACIFIMTATLPVALKDQLRDAAGIAEQHEIKLPANDALLGEARRELHVCEEPLDDAAIIAQIEAQLKVGRVAVVCNTVKMAIRMRQLLSAHEPYLVHSRFTLGDRAARERKEEIEAQRLVIATQVIEVSLDVSFDAMFTQLAPADALLQRMGRVNRHGNGTPAAPVWICCGADDASRKIYDSDLLDATAEWARNFDFEKRRLDFIASLEWIEAVYPGGLSQKERVAMQAARDGFGRVVADLKPMLDPPVDPVLEITLFESIQVVPSRFESQLEAVVAQKNFLAAKELLVNVDLRAWFGASNAAQREGVVAARHRKDLKKKGEYVIANFAYDDQLGLDLRSPNDQSASNFNWGAA